MNTNVASFFYMTQHAGANVIDRFMQSGHIGQTTGCAMISSTKVCTLPERQI